MVRPSENWERLVRAPLRREKLWHDGRGGHERAPSGVAGSVPPSLTPETSIDLILQAAEVIQSEDPNVARILLQFHTKQHTGSRNGDIIWVVHVAWWGFDSFKGFHIRVPICSSTYAIKHASKLNNTEAFAGKDVQAAVLPFL